MCDVDSKELRKASKVLDELVRRSAQLKRSIRVDGDLEELFRQLDTDLRAVKRLLNTADGERLRPKKPREAWVFAGKLFLRIIELLSKVLNNSSLFCKLTLCEV